MTEVIRTTAVVLGTVLGRVPLFRIACEKANVLVRAVAERLPAFGWMVVRHVRNTYFCGPDPKP